MSEHLLAIDSFTGEFAYLSNFYPSRIRYQGLGFPTVEHAFQAQKTFDAAERRRIATCGTPRRAKSLGRQVRLRKDWESVKVGIMTSLVRFKFQSDSELRTKLLSTGDRKLIEGNTWNDAFWGVCGGIGKNWLGRILMQIRAECRGAAESALPTR